MSTRLLIGNYYIYNNNLHQHYQGIKSTLEKLSTQCSKLFDECDIVYNMKHYSYCIQIDYKHKHIYKSEHNIILD